MDKGGQIPTAHMAAGQWERAEAEEEAAAAAAVAPAPEEEEEEEGDFRVRTL